MADTIIARSLCLGDGLAQLDAGEITPETYLQVIAMHCTGIRHGKNQLCNGDTEDSELALAGTYASNIPGPLRKFSYAIAYWIREYIVGLNREVQDPGPIHETLSAWWSDDGEAFIRGIISMDTAYSSIPPSLLEIELQAKEDAKWDRLNAMLGSTWRPPPPGTLSATLCKSLAYAAISNDKADVLRVLLADKDRRADYEANTDFQRAYGDAAFEGLGPAATKAVRDSGMKILTPQGERPTCHLEWVRG